MCNTMLPRLLRRMFAEDTTLSQPSPHTFILTSRFVMDRRIRRAWSVMVSNVPTCINTDRRDSGSDSSSYSSNHKVDTDTNDMLTKRYRTSSTTRGTSWSAQQQGSTPSASTHTHTHTHTHTLRLALSRVARFLSSSVVMTTAVSVVSARVRRALASLSVLVAILRSP